MVDQEKKFDLELDFIDDQKVRDICNDNYILIVGSESILEGDEESADINKYIRNVCKIDSFNQIKGDEEKQKEVFSFFQEKDLGNLRPQNDEKPVFSKGLENLLRTRLFKMVFTTTISRSLETLMENVWGVGNYDVKEYSPNREPAFWANLQKTKKPTLVYLFGKADDINNPENRFVCYDDAAFPFMRALMFDMFLSKQAPMPGFLRGKKILSLGCQFDDWYSRFFWFILTDGLRESNAETVFVLSENDKTPQKKLSKFFNRNKLSVKNYSVSIPEFSKDLEKYFNMRESPITKWIIKPTMENSGIFLSYVGEKRSDVRKLFFKLQGNQYDVCLSDFIIPNDGYPSDVAQTYRNKKLYIIVLTPEIKEMLDNDNTASTIKEKLKNEYKKILEQKKPILLLAVNGYSFASEYHQKLIDIYGQRSGINLMTEGGWEQFTSFLNWIDEERKPNYHEVFISYFNANSVDAYLLYNNIKYMNPWLDYYYLAGVEDWDESIHKAIKESKVFVSLLTYEVMQHLNTLRDNNKTEEEKSKAIRYYQKEIEWAIEENKPIVLYSLNNYQFTSEYHNYLVNKIKLGTKIIGIGKQNDNYVDGFGEQNTKNLEEKIKEIINKQ